MSRRTTLGPLSSSQLNAQPMSSSSRMSLGPVRMTGRDAAATAIVAKPRPSIMHGRPSVNSKPSLGLTRHSSARGDSGADPRPIKEKSFINKNIRVLLNYLQDNNYDASISPSILSRPSVRDFANIIQFLFRKIDPNFTSTGKFEDEVIQMFKALGYPFSISKTALVAVGSPHSWPALLAAVMWIIELLIVDDELTDAEERAETFAGDVSSNQKAFFNYLSRAYRFFMSGDDDRYAALEEEYVMTFETKLQALTEELNEVTGRNEELRNLIREAQARQSQLPELQEKKRDLEKDLEKFHALIRDLKSHKDKLLSTVESRRSDADELKNAIGNIDVDINSLKARVANQEISAEDVERMNQEKKRMEDNLVQVNDHRAHLQRKVWEQEEETSKRMEEIVKIVNEYNSLAEELDLIPITARNAGGINFELCMNNLALLSKNGGGTRTRVLQTDVPKMLLPALSNLRQMMLEMASSTRKELSQKTDEAEDLDVMMEKKEGERAALIGKIQRITEIYKRDKEAYETMLRAEHGEFAELEEKLLQMRDLRDEEANFAAVQRRIGEYKARLASVKEEYDGLKVALIERVMFVAGKCVEHKQHIEERLGAVQQRFEQEWNRILLSQQLGAGHMGKQALDCDVSDVYMMSDIEGVEDSVLRGHDLCDITGLSPIHERPRAKYQDSRDNNIEDSGVEGVAEEAMNLSSVVPEPRISGVGNLAEAIQRAAMEDSKIWKDDDRV